MWRGRGMGNGTVAVVSFSLGQPTRGARAALPTIRSVTELLPCVTATPDSWHWHCMAFPN
jgi:hypothetical protein